MNTPPSGPPPLPPVVPRRRQRPGLVWGLLLAFIGLPSLLLYSVVSGFGLGSDAAALREAVMASGDSVLNRQAELRLGWLPLTAMRQGLRWVELDPQARLALDSIRSVEAGVYASAEEDSADVAGLMAAGDGALRPLGWDRMVGVVHEGDVVRVYSRETPGDPEDLHLCVLVRHEGRLILAAIRCRTGPLLAMLEAAVRPARLPRS